MWKIITLLTIIFLSACVQIEAIREQFVVVKEKHAEDIAYKLELYPLTVNPGKTLKINFLIEPNKDLRNFNLSLIDTCFFETSENEKSFDFIKAGTTKILKFRLKAKDVELETKCKIKFKMEYESDFTVMQDVVVLSKGEYEEREKSGTLGEFSIETVKTNNPLDVSISFSKPQPFVEEDEIYMYIDYMNVGDGIIGKIEKGKIKITLPENLILKECDDFKDGKLSKDLVFIKGKAERSLCIFDTKTESPVDLGKLLIIGKYKYEISDYLIVRIVPR
jgi:hypothetical protein